MMDTGIISTQIIHKAQSNIVNVIFKRKNIEPINYDNACGFLLVSRPGSVSSNFDNNLTDMTL